MNIKKVVENIGTVVELKRIASAYVVDYRNLSEPELRLAVLKAASQYYFPENIAVAIAGIQASSDRNLRILGPQMIFAQLLQADDFSCEKREIEDNLIAWEQSLIDQSNEELLKKNSEKRQNLEFFRFVLETAWGDGDITPDEKNLIERIRLRLKVTETEFRIIEAQLGNFPNPGNNLHTRTEIEDVRRQLQSRGIVFSIRNSGGTDFDVIPDETAKALRAHFGIEIRKFGYREMLRYKTVRKKAYYESTLKKLDIQFEPGQTVEQLQDDIVEYVKPSILLGGLSPRDGIPIDDLKNWCAELSLPVSGTKQEVIQRIIEAYDRLIAREENTEDLRALWYDHFERLAARDIAFFREQQLIQKDIEIERRFEEATNFLFEQKLHHKPLTLVGSAHPDGAISHGERLLLWDNKSKESEVSLKEHLKQFERYIEAAEKPVSGFMVIGPSFTKDSALTAMQFQVERNIPITLISASDLKTIGAKWDSRSEKAGSDPFPLGYLLQNGNFNLELLDPIF